MAPGKKHGKRKRGRKGKNKGAKVADAPSKVPKHIAYVRGNTDLPVKYTARTNFQWNITGGGAPASFATTILTEYPSYIRLNTGAYFQLTMNTDFSKLFLVYDLYCVDRVTVVFEPYNIAEYMGDLATYGVVPPYTANAGPANCKLYFSNDFDDDALQTTEAAALNMSMGHSMFDGKEHRHTFTNRQDRRLKWFNTAAYNPSAVPVTTGTITDQIQNRSSVKMFSPGLTQGVGYGVVNIIYDLRLKGLRTS